MGFFSVLRPCVVGKLHYATVPVQPIEVDDVVAAPLVESGDLEAYRAGGIGDKASAHLDSAIREAVSASPELGRLVAAEYAPTGALSELLDTAPEPEPEKPRPRTPRRPKA